MPGSWRWGILLTVLITAVFAQDGSANEGWSADLGDEVHTASVSDGSVYLITEQDTLLYLSRIDNGSQTWRSPLPNGTPVVRPAVSANIVVCPYGRGTAGINVSDGSLIWNISIELAVDPVVTDDILLLPNGTRLTARDAGSHHAELWNASLSEGVVFILPTEHLVVLGRGDGTVAALNRTEGTQEWVVTPAGGTIGNPLLLDDTLYLVSGNATTGWLNAIDVSGVVEWTREIGRTAADPLSFEGITVITREGRIRTFQANGSEVMTIPTGQDVAGTMVSNGGLVAVSPTGNVTGLRIDNGTAHSEWNLSLESALLPVSGIDGLILFYTRDGRLIAIDDEPVQDPYLVPGSLFTEHDPPLEGYDTTVSLAAGNRGTAMSTIVVTLRIDGEKLGDRTVDLEPGETAVLEFLWEPGVGQTVLAVFMDVDGEELSTGDDELQIVTEVTPTAHEDDIQPLTTILVGFVVLWGLIIGIAIISSKHIRLRKRFGGKGKAEEGEKKGRD